MARNNFSLPHLTPLRHETLTPVPDSPGQTPSFVLPPFSSTLLKLRQQHSPAFYIPPSSAELAALWQGSPASSSKSKTVVAQPRNNAANGQTAPSCLQQSQTTSSTTFNLFDPIDVGLYDELQRDPEFYRPSLPPPPFAPQEVRQQQQQALHAYEHLLHTVAARDGDADTTNAPSQQPNGNAGLLYAIQAALASLNENDPSSSTGDEAGNTAVEPKSDARKSVRFASPLSDNVAEPTTLASDSSSVVLACDISDDQQPETTTLRRSQRTTRRNKLLDGFVVNPPPPPSSASTRRTIVKKPKLRQTQSLNASELLLLLPPPPSPMPPKNSDIGNPISIYSATKKRSKNRQSKQLAAAKPVAPVVLSSIVSSSVKKIAAVSNFNSPPPQPIVDSAPMPVNETHDSTLMPPPPPAVYSPQKRRKSLSPVRCHNNNLPPPSQAPQQQSILSPRKNNKSKFVKVSVRRDRLHLVPTTDDEITWLETPGSMQQNDASTTFNLSDPVDRALYNELQRDPEFYRPSLPPPSSRFDYSSIEYLAAEDMIQQQWQEVRQQQQHALHVNDPHRDVAVASSTAPSSAPSAAATLDAATSSEPSAKRIRTDKQILISQIAAEQQQQDEARRREEADLIDGIRKHIGRHDFQSFAEDEDGWGEAVQRRLQVEEQQVQSPSNQPIVVFDVDDEDDDDDLVHVPESSDTTADNNNNRESSPQCIPIHEVGQRETERKKATHTFKCDTCGNCYTTASNLTRHKRIHEPHGDGKECCPHCGKKYVSPAALQMHILSHVKQFQCTQCDKQFARNWLLTNHMRTHTGERPFVCPVEECKKAFADRSNYRTHLVAAHESKNVDGKLKVVYGGPHVCPGCARSFSLKSYLLKHVRLWCKPAVELLDSDDAVAVATEAVAECEMERIVSRVQGHIASKRYLT